DHLVALADTVHQFCPRSDDFGSERHDLHELLRTKLTGHGPEDAGADRLLLVVQQHGGVAVETDQRAVRAAHAGTGTDHDRVVDLALLDLAARDRVLDGHLDDVTDVRVAALGAAQHLDAHHFLGAGVVGGLEVALYQDMIQVQSYLEAADNSGAKEVMCIKVL